MTRWRMPVNFQLISLIAIAAACATGASFHVSGVQAAQETVTLAFNPPDRSTFIETLSWTRSVKSDGEPLSAGKRQGRAEYHIRRTGEGYSVTVKPLEAPVVASRELGLTIQDLFANATLTYHLDSQGRLVRVLGAEEGMRKVFALFPERERQLLRELHGMAIGNRTASDLAASQWNNRAVLGLFAGQTIPVGTPRKTVQRVPLAIGMTVDAAVTAEALRPADCAGQGCVAILMKYESRDPSLGEALSNFVRNALLHTLRKADTPALRAQRRKRGAAADVGALVPALRYGNFKMEGETVRVVNAATGLPDSEMSLQTITGTVQVDGAQSTFEVTETHKNTYRRVRKLISVPDRSPR